MERLKNWANGYEFETNESIMNKEDEIKNNVREIYQKIPEYEKNIAREEVEKKLDEGLNENSRKYIQNVNMRHFFNNEKEKILEHHAEFLNEKNRHLQSQLSR